MEYIPSDGGPAIHVRKTLIATAGVPWAAGVAEDIFTLTGRVFINRFLAYCTETLVGAGTMEVGGATDPNALLAQIQPDTLVNTEWWTVVAGLPGILTVPYTASPDVGVASMNKVTDEDIILTPAGANVTDGTIIFDCWYEPVTDNGLLVAS